MMPFLKVTCCILAVSCHLQCSFSTQRHAASIKKELTHYEEILPDEESVNASLLHYETLQKEIVASYQRGDYYGVMNTINTYYDVFRRTEASGFMDYYLGASIYQVLSEEAFEQYLRAMDPDLRLVYGVRKVKEAAMKETASSTLRYDNRHFSNLIENRKDYAYERRAIARQLQGQLRVAKSRRALEFNLNTMEWALKRYPDGDHLGAFLKNQQWFPETFINRHPPLSQKYHALKHFHKRYPDHLSSQTKVTEVNVAFPNNYFCVVRNRMHAITSRNLLRLEMWEPIYVLTSPLEGEDGRLWRYVEVRSNVRGYLPEGDMAWQVDAEDASYAVNFWKTCHNYYKKEFILSYKVIASQMVLMNVSKDAKIKRWHERYGVLLNQTLKDIAIRATSKQNEYLAFVRRYPHYFQLSSTQDSVIVSDLVRKAWLHLHGRKSDYLPYMGY